MDDENPTEVTAGAIVTVTVTLIRRDMSILFGDSTVPENNELISENGVGDQDKVENGGDEQAETTEQPAVKRPAWLKQKRSAGKKSKKTNKQNKSSATQKNKMKDSPKPTSVSTTNTVIKKKIKEEKNEDESDESGDDTESNGGDGRKSSEDESTHKSNNEDDDQEWEKIKKLHEREKALEGRSKTSHEVHCPLFPANKQEYWWTYICDRKSRTLLTVPHHVTSLVNEEIVHLKFTAPNWTGVYTFTVCLRSDSYIGFDQQKDIKLDVKEAPAEITEHPQWEFEDSEEDGPAENNAHESDYTTDEDLPEDED